MPPLNGTTISKTLSTAILVAAIGLIESLMTLNLVDDLTGTKGDPNKEAVFQGVAQLCAGIFGGMGGCAMIGQSMINVKSGGTTRLSGFIAGFFLLLIILCAYPVINLIPTASLAGVMFMVCYHTFEWSSLKTLFSSAMPLKWRTDPKFKGSDESKVNRSDAFVVLLVMGVTLWMDLAVAVLAGVVFSALMFSWNSGSNIVVERDVQSKGESEESVTYHVSGSLFFASIQPFMDRFIVKDDPKEVYVSFNNSDVMDWSAIQAISALAAKYEDAEKKVKFVKLKLSSKKILAKARQLLNDDIAHMILSEEVMDVKGAAKLNVENMMGVDSSKI